MRSAAQKTTGKGMSSTFCAVVVNDETGRFSSDNRLQFQHPYPATKIMFIPDKECNCPDLVATTGDYLRIWQLTEEGATLQKLLNNVSKPRRWLSIACVCDYQALLRSTPC